MVASGQTVLMSVVVPTCRSREPLERCLRALVAQDFPGQSYEIIVCDECGDGVAREQVMAFDRPLEQGPRIRYLVPEQSQGRAAARNLGWRAAQAGIIAFTEDDAIPAADWLWQGMLAMRPGVHAAAGVTEVPIPDVPTDFERGAAALARAAFFPANCFVRRAALETVGGFDIRYTMAGPAGMDLYFALLSCDMVVVQTPHARVRLPAPSAGFLARLGMQKRVMFDVLLYRKYPRMYRRHIQHGQPWFSLYAVVSLVAAVLAGVAGHWLVAGILACVWLGLTAQAFLRRARGVSHRPVHLAELALTTAVFPILALAWSLVGISRYGLRIS